MIKDKPMVIEENATGRDAKPAYWLPAKLGEHRVMLIDYGADGVVVEHYRPISSGTIAEFRLEWEGETVTVSCRVRRSDKCPVALGSSLVVFRSNIVFIDCDPQLERRIDAMIQARHLVSIALQMDNASGKPTVENNHALFRNGLVHSESERNSARTDSSRPQEYIRMAWNGTAWATLVTFDAAQPADGFTIDSDEPVQQIHQLCEVYEKTSAEGRNLIRAQARLSIEGKRSFTGKGH